MTNSISQISFDFDVLIDLPAELPTVELHLVQSSPQKLCTKCGDAKSLDDFYETTKGSGKKRSSCKTCESKASSDRHRKNPVKRKHSRLVTRRTNLKRFFGLTIEEYDSMFESQGGVCAICGKPETAIDHRTKQVRRLAVDHDHETGKLRALLCGKCNTALGHFEKDALKYKPYLDQYR